MSCTSPSLFMKRALDLACQAEGETSPNPLVGAVIVYQDKIIGEGYHHRAGQPHAEVNAFESVAPEARKWIPLSTLYVTLEPCCHRGKTPPCTDRILKEGVKKVVVAMQDPFPQVGGKGIEKLRAAGVEVQVGLLEKEARQLNAMFLVNVLKRRPYITLKWAESKDGYIDAVRDSMQAAPTKFSSELRLRETHRLRHQHDAILVGANTFQMDNPSLTNRYWSGKSPIRIVWDSRDSLFQEESLRSKLFTESVAPVWLITASPLQQKFPPFVHSFVLSRGTHFLQEFIDLLNEKGVKSLLVEGGAKVLQTFLSAHLYDAVEREIAPFMLFDGTPSPLSFCEETPPQN